MRKLITFLAILIFIILATCGFDRAKSLFTSISLIEDQNVKDAIGHFIMVMVFWSFAQCIPPVSEFLLEKVKR